MLRDVPATAERIGELPVAFAPELIGDLMARSRCRRAAASASGTTV
jgi:hypothetical protein